MSELVVAPLLVALVAAVLTLALGRRPTLQRAASAAGGVAYAAAVGAVVDLDVEETATTGDPVLVFRPR